jgi:hypothetical protein
MSENDYMAGRRSAYTAIMAQCVQALGAEGSQSDWIVEREEIRRVVKDLAKALKIDADWPDHLHLADVIEKHIIPQIRRS